MLAPHNSNSSPAAWERVHWNTIKNLLEGLGFEYQAAMTGGMDIDRRRSKTVLITGAAGGIGRASVTALRGKRLARHRRGSLPAVQLRRPELSRNRVFSSRPISPTPRQPEPFSRRRAAFTHRLDALVNNAAVQVAKPLVETTVEEWDAVMASNLRSAFLFVKLAHPLLKAAGGGAIVNVSSVHAIQTSANIAAYAASKGGLLALTRAMAIEFAPDNIRVNAILPGAVDTPMLRAGLGRGHVGQGDMQERLDNLARKTVNGRVGKPPKSPMPSISWPITSNPPS